MCIYIHVCQNWFMKPLTGKPTLGWKRYIGTQGVYFFFWLFGGWVCSGLWRITFSQILLYPLLYQIISQSQGSLVWSFCIGRTLLDFSVVKMGQVTNEIIYAIWLGESTSITQLFLDHRSIDSPTFSRLEAARSSSSQNSSGGHCRFLAMANFTVEHSDYIAYEDSMKIRCGETKCWKMLGKTFLSSSLLAIEIINGQWQMVPHRASVFLSMTSLLEGSSQYVISDHGWSQSYKWLALSCTQLRRILFPWFFFPAGTSLRHPNYSL